MRAKEYGPLAARCGKKMDFRLLASRGLEHTKPKLVVDVETRDISTSNPQLVEAHIPVI